MSHAEGTSTKRKESTRKNNSLILVSLHKAASGTQHSTIAWLASEMVVMMNEENYEITNMWPTFTWPQQYKWATMHMPQHCFNQEWWQGKGKSSTFENVSKCIYNWIIIEGKKERGSTTTQNVVQLQPYTFFHQQRSGREEMKPEADGHFFINDAKMEFLKGKKKKQLNKPNTVRQTRLLSLQPFLHGELCRKNSSLGWYECQYLVLDTPHAFLYLYVNIKVLRTARLQACDCHI